MKMIVLCLCLLTTSLCALADDSFVIGASVPLTGDLAEYGTAVQNGFKLSKEDFSSTKLRYRFEDNRYDSLNAVAAYRKLKTEQGVDLIFSWGEAPLHAISGIAEREQTPVLAMSVDARPAQDKKFVLLTINPPSEYVGKVLRHIRKMGYKKIGLIKTDDAFMHALSQEIEAQVLPDESVQVLGTVLPGETDLRQLASRVRSSSVDVLGVYLTSGQVQSFYRHLAAMKIALPSFGTDIFESRAEIQGAKGAMTGAVYPNLKVPNDFVARYNARFGNDSQITYAYHAFTIGNWCEQLLVDGATKDSSAIINRFTLRALNEVVTPFSYEVPENNPSYLKFPMVMRRVTANGFEDFE